MSTILKALRRLEHDRSSRTRGPLRQQVANEPKARSRARRWPLLIAAVVCGTAAGPLALVVWTELLPRSAGPESPADPAPSIANEAQAAAPSLPGDTRETLPLPAPLAPPLPDDEPLAQEFVAEAPPPPIVSDEVEMLRRPAAGPRIAAHPDEAPARPTGPRPGSVRPRPYPARTAVAQRPPVSTGPAPLLPASEPPPREVIAEIHDAWEVDAAPEPDSGADGAMPRGSDAVASAALAPALRVERTEWHPSPERRVAIVAVDGKSAPVRLQEGDSVGALVVGEIQPSAVTFYHEGIELRRRVGE